MKQVAAYGFWRSPFTAELVAGESVRLGEPRIDTESVYWLEGRPSEGGRTALVRRGPDGGIRDRLERRWNVRSRVHEYGGGAYAVADGTVYFSDSADRRLYRAVPSRDPKPLTPPGPRRYADLEVDKHRDLLVSTCEDHSDAGREAEQSIVALDLARPRPAPRTLVSGADFYASARLSPRGDRLCWLEWRHPNMPWDGTDLWVGALSGDGEIRERRKVAGGPRESVFQPQWSPAGELYFVTDRSGYWNLYRDDGSDVAPVYPCEAEFGLPQWLFGMSTYGIAEDGRILAAYCRDGEWGLALIDRKGAFEPIETPYCLIDGVAVRGSTAVFRAASPSLPSQLVRFDLGTRNREILARSAELPEALLNGISTGCPISFRSVAGRTVHGFYFAPWNPDFEAPPDEKPPMIIRLHGGPTAAASNALSLSAQFWTSRGFALLDLNYSGSTGYGRSYRTRLDGNWGVADVDDTVAAARHFASAGLADPDRIIVKGGSAGGYTALCCLAFRDEFAAGASYYGISELKGLARDTHKFESRYHETLIGPWPARSAVYEERSPLSAADRVSAPTIFFQGAEDPVVPKEQTEVMVEALRSRGIPVAYYLFEGESHGFRDGATVRRALEAELGFYCATLLRRGSAARQTSTVLQCRDIVPKAS